MKEQDAQAKLSLKLQAYQYLKTKILNCEYRPNEFLNEQKLCAEMGNISRTPMRDALGRLEQEGLITILPKKGLMVSGITEEDVHSMFEMRLLVEPYALRTYGNAIPREQLEASGGKVFKNNDPESAALIQCCWHAEKAEKECPLWNVETADTILDKPDAVPNDEDEDVDGIEFSEGEKLQMLADGFCKMSKTCPY